MWDWGAGSLRRLIRQTWHVWAFLYWLIAFLFQLSILRTTIKKWRMGIQEKGEAVTHFSHLRRRDYEPKTILSWLFSGLPSCCSHLAGWFTLYFQLPCLKMFAFLTPSERYLGNRVWSRRVVANFGDAALWGRRSMSCVLS